MALTWDSKLSLLIARLEFGTVGVNGRQTCPQDVGDTLIIGDTDADESEHTGLGRESLALLDLDFTSFLQQLVHFVDKVRVDVPKWVLFNSLANSSVLRSRCRR